MKKEVLNIGTQKINKDNRFFEASVDGQSLKAYVDLSSQCVTLRKSNVDQLNLQLNGTTEILRGCGGAVVKPHGISKINMKVDLAEATVKAHVVPDDSQEVPVIVDQPFTDQKNVVVVQKGGDLRIFEVGAANLLEVEKLPPRKVELWAESASVIPANEGANIKE